MSVIASFNYAHSKPAVIACATISLIIAAGLIWTGRPWLAAAIGAVAWAALGYAAGFAGQGDMAGLFAILYAGMAALSGAVTIGAGAWVKARCETNKQKSDRLVE